ncbi:MAG: TdeIII family type II restriction endonuclease [Flavobacteriaceae bacterium]
MALKAEIKEKISIEVIKTLITRFENFPEDASKNRNAPFHEAFLNAFANKFEGKVTDVPFFISMSSWLHGLNTTLGQTFFENIAYHLSNGEKREYTSKRLGNLPIRQTQRNQIASTLAKLSYGEELPNLINEDAFLFTEYEDEIINAMDFSADVFIEDNDSVTAIELKSVKPNSGEMRGEKQKILEGKAALYRLFPNKKIHFYIGFPFDPTVNPLNEPVTSYNKTRFLNSIINMNKFFAPNECLLANELWDFLSGQTNTMEEILEIINTISTPKFLEKFHLLTDNTKRTLPEYRAQLEEWNLNSELEIIHNTDNILKKIKNDNSLVRIYNKTILNNKGSYNFERYHKLISVIK